MWYLEFCLYEEDCRGPLGLAMTDHGGLPAVLVEKTKPIQSMPLRQAQGWL
jgi:hypothetical protein